MYNSTWVPNTMPQKKKPKSQFKENYRAEGKTKPIHRTLLATIGGPIIE